MPAPTSVPARQLKEGPQAQTAAGPSTGGGTYSGTATTTVGGITNGDSFSSASMQDMWDALIAPYAAPAFSSFAISGVSSPVEVGYSFGAGVTFTWGTTNSGNVAANAITINDAGSPVATSQANDGTQAVTLGGAVTRTTAGTHAFSIDGVNTHAGTFTRSLTITWSWRLYYGAQAATTLSAAQILALASSALATSYAGSFATAAGGYKYICLADAAGGQITTVKDAATLLAVPMATSADHANYSNVDGGGFSYALVSVTNAQGVTSNVRVYRTKNSLGGAVTLVVT